MLTFSSGAAFSTSSAPYDYVPEESPRVNIEVEIEGNRLSAAIDTAAPYFVCGKQTADALGIAHGDALQEVVLWTRKGRLRGGLYRIALTLVAAEGNSMELEVTAFVPDDDIWDEEPSFLGMYNCLDRLRFAVDPAEEIFYFGKP